MKTNKIRKILFLRTENIGDYIVSLPAIKTIRKNFPKSKITIVVGPWNKQLAKATPYVDKVIVFDNPLAKRNLRTINMLQEIILGLPRLIKFRKFLNKQNYDLLIIFSNRKFNRFFIPLFNNNVIWGANFEFGETPEEERCKQTLYRGLAKKGIKLKDGLQKVCLNILEEDKQKIRKLLKKEGIKKKKFICIHAITPLSEKNWPKEKWGELIKKLKYPIIMIGRKSEREEIEKIMDLAGENKRIINLGGKINLLQTIELINASKIFIGSDSGPMHLAKLTSTPIIALFGPTNEKIWGPTREIDKIIKKKTTKKITIVEVLKRFPLS